MTTTRRVGLRIALFGAGLVAIFGVAYAAGGAIDPEGADPEAPSHADAGAHDGARAPETSAAAPARVVVDDSRFERGSRETLAFRVVDRDGRTVEDFDLEHERAMHVIAVRHDLTGYQHVHPRQRPDGSWEVEIAFPEAGPHRVYADFSAGGRGRTLAADVEVSGPYAPRALPGAATTAGAGAGYVASLRRDGDGRVFTVTRDGRPVADVEPYLGARGHLVALREGDLAFQHVHPRDAATEGLEIAFDVALAEPGRYRLFLQFKHDGEVRTAAFTETVDAGSAAHGHAEGGHGH